MQRHKMRRIREVLRLKFELQRPHREISAATGLSKGSVGDYLRRAREAGVTWEVARELSDRELEQKLFRAPGRNLPVDRVPIDLEWVHRELRKKGVTLQLLWAEYCDAARHDQRQRRPYQYSQFCERYRQFTKRVDAVMRQEHRAGEKCFVDYSGAKPKIVDRKTGEVIEVELYVAVLGASNFAFAEATRTQQRDEFIGSTVRAFEYFGGVTKILVPDQLRSAVSGPHRIDPEINPVFAEFAEHYGVAVVPARPRRPRDKAKVENGVLLVQRWILAKLRNITFFSLEDLNGAIAELLEQLNDHPFRKLDGCRRSVFEAVDKPAMAPLPPRRFEPSTWKKAKIHIDYHVEFEHRYYSAPHALIGEQAWVRATVSTIEVILDGRRIASHVRSYGPVGAYVTADAHRPKSHRQYGAWPPQRIIEWASELGPHAARVVEKIISDRPHPEQGYRSCLALINDAKRYSADRVEAACRRALAIGAPTRRSVIAILKNGLDRIPLDDAEADDSKPVAHENVRGGDYYATKPEDEDDRRRDVSKTLRDEADGDGRGLPRDEQECAGRQTELWREGGAHGGQGVDCTGEPTPDETVASGEADQ